MFKKDKIIYYIFLITIASTSLYVVFKNLPPIIGSFRYFWAPISLLIILISNPRTYIKKPIGWILVYGVLMIGILQYSLWQYMTESTKPGIIEEFYNLLVFTAIFTFLYFNRNYIIWARLSKMAFFFILITLVGTNIALSIDPLVVRNSAGSAFTPFQNHLAKQTGAAGYGYAQAFVLLIPILVYHIKNRKPLIFKRRILIIILVLIVITLIRSQVFGNILAAIAILILSFSGTQRARKSFLSVALISIILIAIPRSIYADLFYSARNFFEPSSVMHQKLADFAMFIENPDFTSEHEAVQRAERYPMLFEAFSASPIFGNASYKNSFDTNPGFHLYWMNRLTQWGILGFSFFLFILYQLFKKISSLFDANFKFYYFLSIGAFILLGLMKNIAGREPFLMLILIIPGFYLLPLLKSKRL